MRVLFGISLVLALAACGGDERASQATGGGAEMPRSGGGDGDGGCTAGTESRAIDERYSWAVTAKGRVAAFRRPGGRRLEVFEPETSLGAAMVFAVRSVIVDRKCDPTWYRVQLPMKPNGSTGYVRAGDVRPFRVATRITIDLSSRRLVLYRAGRRLVALTIGIGSDDTPTPTGAYYVNQKVRVTDPGGPFGPRAIGVSAFSPVLTGWAEGGPIAIHGTNDPSSIGNAKSNGCLHVRNDQLLHLYDEVPVGTPVVIRA